MSNDKSLAKLYAKLDRLQMEGDYEELLQIADYALDAVRNDGARVFHALFPAKGKGKAGKRGE